MEELNCPMCEAQDGRRFKIKTFNYYEVKVMFDVIIIIIDV